MLVMKRCAWLVCFDVDGALVSLQMLKQAARFVPVEVRAREHHPRGFDAFFNAHLRQYNDGFTHRAQNFFCAFARLEIPCPSVMRYEIRADSIRLALYLSDVPIKRPE